MNREADMKKIAFVLPWYADNIPGGAEYAARATAKHLQKAGIKVEILTTCVKEFKSDWNVNAYIKGVYNEAGVIVRRFKVKNLPKTDFKKINTVLMNGQRISQTDENLFFTSMLHSPSLINYIKKNKNSYHCFIFMPYMFQTTIEGVAAAKEKAVIIPCLHDEAYAYTNTIKNTMESAIGIIYLSKPERDLANKLYNLKPNIKQMTLGVFLKEPDKIEAINFDVDSFNKEHKINSPYILYAGRKDYGKNADLLERYFLYYKAQNQNDKTKLVFIGDRTKSTSRNKDIIDLGFVSNSEKYSALAGALFLCQPSIMESFSIVIMESWQQNRPVVVHTDCAVTKNFVEESHGGLWFNSYNTFASIIDYMKNHVEQMEQMALNGKNYVENNFSPEAMIHKLDDFLRSLYQ